AHDLAKRGRAMSTLHEYRVRPVAEEPTPVLVRVVVDLPAKTLTVEWASGARATFDVVTARALYMALSEAVYGSLEPEGPYLRVESNSDRGWSADAHTPHLS
ncbi:MAG: hypothetical protein ACRDT6_02455, partial [Micromonosporaceae bacterium]